MSKIGVRLNIDVTKIDKARLFKGVKGTYLDATVFINDEADRYGNHGFIAQEVSKEERESGVKGPILGSVKVFFRDGSQPETSKAAPSKAEPQQPAPGGYDDEFNDDLPFD